MKQRKLAWIRLSKLPALTLTIVLLTCNPADASMPVCCMELEGDIQGRIEGSCTASGRKGAIAIYGMEHEIGSPLNFTTKLPTGRVAHHPLTITKEFDKSSPGLYKALCNGEKLKNVTLKFYRASRTGTDEHYFTIKLENAIIVSIKPHFPAAFEGQGKPRHTEKISFTYRKIRWIWEPDEIESQGLWQTIIKEFKRGEMLRFHK